MQLDYSDALATLSHADRKSPAGIAKGFRAQVKKFLIIVQLLLGEIPERSVFESEDLKATLRPYLALTQVMVSQPDVCCRVRGVPCWFARPA